MSGCARSARSVSRVTRSSGTLGVDGGVKKENSRAHVKLEYDVPESAVEELLPAKRERKPSKRELAPGRWKETLDALAMQRGTFLAPVDTMGCERVHDITRTPQEQRFESLVGLMLSSQTKDEVTAGAVGRLQVEGLTIDNIIAMDEDKIKKLIYPVGFYNRKAGYLKEAAMTLRDKYDNDIPETVEEMMKLKGVGPKMAHLLYNTAWAGRDGRTTRPSGIGVDVHVHRISNRLGWVKSTNPEGTRKQLEQLLPEELWTPINPMLVGFGQVICKAISPKCGECAISSLCPSANVRVKKAKIKRASTK